MDRKLPPETWLDISLFLKRNELSELSMGSKYLLRNLRPKIYREVMLPSVTDMKYLDRLQATLKLLSTDVCLASSILTLHVHGEIGEVRRPYVLVIPFELLISAMSNMKSLRSLYLNGQIVRMPEEQKELVRVLCNNTQNLEEFRWVARFRSFPIPELPISTLRVLQWSNEVPAESANYLYYVPALPSVLEASKDKLQHLILPLSLDQHPGHRIWQLRFPSLRTAHFQSEYVSTFIWPDEVINFLVDHLKTLESVTLDFSEKNYGRRKSTCSLSFYASTSENPISLRTISGEINMVRSIMQQFHTDKLEQLSIHEQDPIPVNQLSSTLQGFPTLKTLLVSRLILEDVAEHQQIHSIAQACSGLTVVRIDHHDSVGTEGKQVRNIRSYSVSRSASEVEVVGPTEEHPEFD